MRDFASTKPMGMYEDAIGEKNQRYYIEKFEDFDQKGPDLHASWNWPAFFFTAFWALYRKMYGWFVIWLIVLMFFRVFLIGTPSTQTALAMLLVNIALWLGFTVFANSLYHRKVKARLAAVKNSNSNALWASKKLSAGGGVHTWVPVVFGGIPIIGILAAVALPAYQDYTKRSTASIAQGVSVNPSDANLSAASEIVPFKGTLDEAASISISDKQILKKQGIGGNQELADVAAWGDAQMSARFFDESEFAKAHSFVLMWQRQIINKLRLSPERALFLGYNIVTSQYDQKMGICRPNMSKNGGVEDLPGVDMKISPECFVRD